ncbi:hypothetical protein [Mycobacterium gallinarum]
MDADSSAARAPIGNKQVLWTLVDVQRSVNELAELIAKPAPSES